MYFSVSWSMTTKSGLKIIFDPQTTFYNLFDSCSFLYFDLDMAKHTGTYFTFSVIVLDLLTLIHFAQKKDTKEMLIFQNYWCLCSRWEEKAREKTKDQKKGNLKLTIGKIWLNPKVIKFDDSSNSLQKKSNYAKTSVKLTLFCKVNLY